MTLPHLDALTGAEIPGVLNPASAVVITNTMLEMLVIAGDPGDANNHYPGITLRARTNVAVSATSPAIFEVDRNKVDWKLVTGTGAKETHRRSGFTMPAAPITSSSMNSPPMMAPSAAGSTTSDGPADDNPVVTGTATAIPAFGPSNFNDQGAHRLKAIANGTDVKLYLDDVYGATVPFPFGPVSFGHRDLRRSQYR